MTAEVWTIGVDVGGTKIAGGVVRFPAGAVTLREAVATRPERGPEAVLNDVRALVGRLALQSRGAGAAPVALGIGVPELVDLQGRITSAATVDWRGVVLANHFAEWQTFAVEADVRAAALAEAHWGAGRGYEHFLYVSVGTGLSACLVQNGHPLSGARGNALILASGRDVFICAHCGSRSETVLEEFASGPGLVRLFGQAQPGSAATAEQVVARATAGDPTTLHVVTRAGEALGNRVGLAVNLLDPEAVIVGGGLGLAGGPYWQSLCDAARAAIWAPDTRELPIVTASLGNEAGLIGAAALVWQSTTKVPHCT
ncbi:MAG: ROK family protein [Planctomycetaceae bacterium]